MKMSKKQQRLHNKKRQEEWDTLWVITNRILDVAIMFFSVFFVIYLFNQDYKPAIIYLILDIIVIPLNNGPQAFRYVHHKISVYRANRRKEKIND